MFRIYRGSTADEVWRAAWADVDAGLITDLNPLRGGSQEILHAALSISDPRQRWVTSRVPAINPAFALAEVVWVVCGRRDAGFLTAWNSALPRYAGPAREFHGAYGYRLRHHFGVDQLTRATQVLSAQPGHRQVVLQIWDPTVDLPSSDGTPRDDDIPCNVSSQLKVRDGRLEWLQVMRSNDLVLGLPYNLIQWTTLQEVLAGWLGLEMGSYNHVSDSLHRYNRDVQAYQCRRSGVVADNDDDLRLPIDVSRDVFKVMAQFLVALTTQSPDRASDTCTSLDLPRAYMNWTHLFLADRLRRLGEHELAAQSAGRISNPALATALKLWNERFEAKRE